MRFEGKRAIVTGAGSGIGHELTTILLEEGAQVVGLDINVESIPRGAIRITSDLQDVSDVGASMAKAIDALGGLDILCNNAGIGSTKSVLECAPDEWDRVFAVNVRAVYLGIRAALPTMLAAGAGVIVNTASVAGTIGLLDRAAYCASKGAVIALTKQVAIQYAGQGIRCNCVCPGTIDSPWVQRLMEEAADPAERRRNLVARQPVGRLGQPIEVARAIAYLASSESDFMTGSELVIDGGILAG